MIYRSRKREFDASALVFIGIILIFVTTIVCVTTAVTRSDEYKHIEKMEQIKACKEEE